MQTFGWFLGGVVLGMALVIGLAERAKERMWWRGYRQARKDDEAERDGRIKPLPAAQGEAVKP